MKLCVQYTAQLQHLVGVAQERLVLPEGCSVAELISAVAAKCEAARPHLLTTAGQIRPSLVVAVNHRAVPADAAAATLLCEGDVVTLLPPIAGG